MIDLRSTRILTFFVCIINCAHIQNAQADDDSAIQVKLLNTDEEWDNVSGGTKRATTNIDLQDVNIALDAEKKWGWTGATFMLDGLYINGRQTTPTLSGTTQTISPIEDKGTQMIRLYQAWYNQDLWNGKTSVLIGLYDLNTEFDSLNSAALFFNSGYNWASALDLSGIDSPSTYPDTAFGARVHQWLDQKDGISVQFAALDGVPDEPKHPWENTVQLNHSNGVLLVGEADYYPNSDLKILAGYWYYIAKFDEFKTDMNGDPLRSSDNQGAYAGIHKRLYSISPKRGLDGFINAGITNGNINQVDSSFATGLMFTGLLGTRPTDQIGFAWNLAHNSNPFKESEEAAGTPVLDNEMNYELTYRAKINDWITIQPDAQYTVNPGTNPTLKNDFIVGMRVEIGYGFGL